MQDFIQINTERKGDSFQVMKEVCNPDYLAFRNRNRVSNSWLYGNFEIPNYHVLNTVEPWHEYRSCVVISTLLFFFCRKNRGK